MSAIRNKKQNRAMKGANRAGGIFLACAVALPLILLLAFLAGDAVFPLPLPGGEGEDFAVAVTSADGSPLRVFPDKNGVWRYPVTPDQVSPLYLEALLTYEDRYFYRHPGFNPFSLGRAFAYMVSGSDTVIGGSTLTMQVARILDPHAKTIPGKCKQIFRALQLEWYFSKDEILTLYLNYAPFGGPVEGVQAASFTYLGKPAKELSHAEAALLAVLPQSPSRLRPDRHPDRAQKARDKVLKRMATRGVWAEETALDAMMEGVDSGFAPRPMMAPLLARRLKEKARPDAPVHTFIDPSLQENLEAMAGRFIASTPEATSAAILVMENACLEVKAYVGSGDFLDDSRFGHVDMVRAIRSPGSTLKPYLYAFAMEEGLIHSQSLLVDAPFTFSGYRPGNFESGFAGPVSAAEALQRSLNIPAVDILDRLGPEFFDSRLRQGGLNLEFPPHQGPNLAMILGGTGTSLESMVGAFAAFDRHGLAGRPRLTREEPMRERRLMKPGSAFIVRVILSRQRRPGVPGGNPLAGWARNVAWKTGTSYGFRDSWAIGTSGGYTVGVWVGRPDGTPSPGYHGRATAAPLMFSAFDCLPRRAEPPHPMPASVSRVEICWPLGTIPDGEDDPLCGERRTAWILDGTAPPTLPDRLDDQWTANPITVMVNPQTGLRVDGECPVTNPVPKKIALWPRAAAPWLNPREKAGSAIPALDPSCGKAVSATPSIIKIVGILPDSVLRPAGASQSMPVVELSALGGRGRLYWMVDRILIGSAGIGESITYPFTETGNHELTVLDMAGNSDTVAIQVMGSS
ncbi:MAG: penicillin-binding protein 1C [Desulfatibacillum sp.]|nr:penicillin-binding protein 1C [Desulfatibacillum sp.]